ncbi:acetyl-CoA carboxylase biotin carboxyl carrier protein [Gluconobacter wancherniae]|uniref:acetyl-CoA carboxylase biotin carboxyl carrier protein n=1 Tax=Gluconobacter wancherniae TaxID=1307955 RepID=UPI001B8B0B10|nr:biotin/lipoyl-containing protein [Gluconobacter wancherniae]MBS1095022.1 acetyl-CoA carboxylase biotin carboxyl carrier protein subunit [Gluconobacter wancherniae]
MIPDLKILDALMARMQALGITELDYSHEGEHIRLVRGGPDSSPQPTSPTPKAAASTLTVLETASAPAKTETTIDAPMHGQFYASPAPDAPPFVKPGDIVAEGQPLYILEVMKTLSRIETEFPCRIVAVLAANADAVSPGTPLFTVEPLDA